MKFTEKRGWTGVLSAHIIDPAWKGAFPTRWPREKWPVIRQVFQKHNLVTKPGQLRSYTNGLSFTYIAGGDGTTPPTRDDTDLANELLRFAVEDQVNEAGKITVFTTIPSGVGGLTWQEWGVFMDDALITSGSGTMYSRILQQYTKVISDNVLVTYVLNESIVE
jgi:hypothetical protein